MFARSLAGHDKGQLFVITGEEDGYVFLADGRGRGVQKPKKKKIKHVQIMLQADPAIHERVENSIPLRDEDIRKAIRTKEDK